MKNFEQAITKKLLEQKQVIDSQANCQQCQIYQAAYNRNSSEEPLQSSLIDFYSKNEPTEFQPQLNYLGTYKGLDYQHVQHGQSIHPFPHNQNFMRSSQVMCPKHHNLHIQANISNNQIVSQSKIIIPRGIINFKKLHSVSIERQSSKGIFKNNNKQPYNNLNDPSQPQIFQQKKTCILENQLIPQIEDLQLAKSAQQNNFYSQTQKHTRENSLNEIINQQQNILIDDDPNLKSVEESQKTIFLDGSNQNYNQNQRTFMLEPRDESLMRKKKVIEILKTFQEESNDTIQKQVGDKLPISQNPQQKNQFGEEFVNKPIIQKSQNKQNPNQKEKKKSHSNLPYSLQSFIKDPFQSNTFYMGKPIIVKQNSRIKKQNPQKVRRRDQPQILDAQPANENPNSKIQDRNKNQQLQKHDLMSDLNNFIMIEDLKINQDEEKFYKERQNNQSKFNGIINNESTDFFEGIVGSSKQNQDFGLNLVQNSRISNDQFNQSLQFDSQQIDCTRISLNDDESGKQVFNLQSQIKNLDQIFEPEPEYIKRGTNSSRIDFNC